MTGDGREEESPETGREVKGNVAQADGVPQDPARVLPDPPHSFSSNEITESTVELWLMGGNGHSVTSTAGVFHATGALMAKLSQK